MRIKEIELQTANLAQAAAFYNEVLQLPVVQRSPHRITFAAGYSLIHFKEEATAAGVYHFAFLIPPNLFLSAYQWLQSRLPLLPFNETEAIADFKNWNAKAFYFQDGKKNILEFIAHYDLEGSNMESFTPQAIIGIAEMGIGVADATQTCQALHTIYSIPYYSKGPRLQNFVAMGEEDGLLIVSEAGRGWLPTGQLTAINKVAVELELNGERISLAF
jgi:catechol 2,3-dioxygenase-like lactoylglutathione lyase family enzyme